MVAVSGQTVFCAGKFAPEGKLMDLLCYCCTAGHIIGAGQSLFKTASGALAQHRLISRPASCPRNHPFAHIADPGSSLSISGKLSVLHRCRTRPYLALSNRPGCIWPGESALLRQRHKRQVMTC